MAGSSAAVAASSPPVASLKKPPKASADERNAFAAIVTMAKASLISKSSTSSLVQPALARTFWIAPTGAVVKSWEVPAAPEVLLAQRDKIPFDLRGELVADPRLGRWLGHFPGFQGSRIELS